MNFVSISPHFPPNYQPFCVNLRQMGVTVLGLADAPFDDLHSNLKSALANYYRVSDLHNYDELVKAFGYFTHHYGKIDRVESHNEYWLETDARLRTDFNIPGFHIADLPGIKQKSEMKKIFKKAGLESPRGKVVHNLFEARTLVDEIGFPIVAKPDSGVGAYKTYRIDHWAEVENFFAESPTVEYIFEEFIHGSIQSFDGLVDQDGKIVFSSSMNYDGVMEIVNEELDIWYHIVRQIPPDLEQAGRKLVNAYHLRERFFHFEFFRTPDGRLVALEVNMRPPGGLTTDMWNYANDIDIYHEFANVVVNNRFGSKVDRPYFCAFVGTRKSSHYHHNQTEILSAFPHQIVHHEPIMGTFSSAMGDYGYIIRSPELGEIEEIVNWIFSR